MWLYVLLALVLAGGLVLIFARDWVWSIDNRGAAFERDENGVPIRTPAWDRNHLLAGVLMVVVAVVLAGALALWL
ncbi:MAG: hypothetical protein AAF787_00510 [Chloroflexota bacterium]